MATPIIQFRKMLRSGVHATIQRGKITLYFDINDETSNTISQVLRAHIWEMVMESNGLDEPTPLNFGATLEIH